MRTGVVIILFWDSALTSTHSAGSQRKEAFFFAQHLHCCSSVCRIAQELLSGVEAGYSTFLPCAVLLSWHRCLQAKETMRCLARPSRTRHRRPTLWCRHPARLPRARPRPTLAPLARRPATAPPATAPIAAAPIAIARTTTLLAATAPRRTATVHPRTVALQATALPAARHLQADSLFMETAVGLYAEGFSAPAGEL